MTKRPISILTALTVLVLGLSPAVFAEVVCDLYCNCLRITEEPDPTGGPWAHWQQVRLNNFVGILNVQGDERGDAPPEMAFDPVTGCPAVVWSFNTGIDYDIAYSEWAGDDWSAMEFLSSSLGDDLDPDIHIDDEGKVYVVWWRSLFSDVLLITRPPEGNWANQTPSVVTPDGRRPTVALHTGAGGQEETLLVAFERDAEAGGQEVVVLAIPSEGEATETVVGTTSTTGPLDVDLHVEGEMVWIDWKHGSDTFGWAEYEAGSWSDVMTLPWENHTWIGEEEIRRVIRHKVLAD